MLIKNVNKIVRHNCLLGHDLSRTYRQFESVQSFQLRATSSFGNRTNCIIRLIFFSMVSLGEIVGVSLNYLSTDLLTPRDVQHVTLPHLR